MAAARVCSGRTCGPEIDLLEHERAQGVHRLPDLLALPDPPLALGRLHEVVDERVDSLRAGRAEDVELFARKVVLV